jgi:glutamate synthase domain-containing protein 3
MVDERAFKSGQMQGKLLGNDLVGNCCQSAAVIGSIMICGQVGQRKTKAFLS